MSSYAATTQPTTDEREPTVVDRLEYVVVRAAMTLLGGVSRERALRLGARIGELFYLLYGEERRVALNNLARAFPQKSDAEHREILRRSCRNLGRSLGEACHFDKITADNVANYVTIEDPEGWAKILARSKVGGGIALTAHYGNFELLAWAHALLGNPITLAHRTMRNPLVDKVILEMRGRVGTVSVPKKSAARTLLRALSRGQMIALLADQNQGHNSGVFANLFGVPACTTPGPARLAMQTGSLIVPVFLVRQGESDRHRMIFYPEIEVANTGDKLNDVIATTERCNRAIERVLTDYPEQWIWFHKRWKTRPAGEPSIY